MDATYVPISRRKDKEDVVYMHSGVLFSHQKEWNFVIGENMDGSRGNRAKWNKSDKRKADTFTYMWNLKSKQTSITKQKQRINRWLLEGRM